MSKRIFSEEQLNNLRQNSNVAKCGVKTISYDRNFKVRAVKQYLEDGKTAKEIFREAGFNLEAIGTDAPKDLLKRWRRVFKIRGADGLMTETRGRGGGRTKTKGMGDADKIKYLEAKVAYLKAENDFLAKLRAKRAE